MFDELGTQTPALRLLNDIHKQRIWVMSMLAVNEGRKVSVVPW